MYRRWKETPVEGDTVAAGLLGYPVNRHPADGLHVAAAGQGEGLVVEADGVPDVRVAAEHGDGRVPVLLADSRVDVPELLHADADVTDDDEQICWFANGLLEPVLSDGVADGLHSGVVGVAGEVKEEAKGRRRRASGAWSGTL